jgi:hypothetical protein
MARFNRLHDASTVVCEILRDRIDPGLEILPAPPLENATAPAEAIRITLLWVTPQPTHRNDIWETRFDGTLEPPPLSLSGFYLVTTYGTADNQEPEQAYNLLGQVLQVFDLEPEIELPQPPITDLGEGSLGVVLVPTAADLMEKIYTPLQMRHRPWALLEVSPIQLISLSPEGPQRPIVRPGGIRLAPLDVTPPPEIESFAPSIASVDSLLRLNARYSGTVEYVRIGDETIVNGPALSIPEPGRVVLLTIPATVTPGTYDIFLRVNGVSSTAASVEIRPNNVPSVDAPSTLNHALGADLILTGRMLDGAMEVIIWPERGISSPADVIALPVSNVTSSQVTVTATALSAAAIQTLPYRLTVRVSLHVFTPFVQLEFTP